ncbi:MULTISPECIES: site-specific integrase [Haloarcula]|uniref:site-specific integrase n=1 Tax=Haloarcula TaxID=2237 RepID=UPI0023E889CA|nr:site-specific integrase [Halomicroarcula sp. SHR3]
MARDYPQQYQDTRDRVKEHRHGGSFEVWNGREEEFPAYEDPNDADRIIQMANAYEEDNLLEETPDGQKPKSPTTLKNYLSGLKKIAPHLALTDTTAGEINAVMQGFYDGDVSNVKDDGLSKGTIRVYQNALRQFYYVHDDTEVDPEDVKLFTADNSGVDPSDMLDREEIQEIRSAATCMRDKALFDFLIYAGQRNTAARTLRIRDLDLPNERFKLNEDAEGLKGAEKNGKWRDMLLSSTTVQQYLDTEHPDPNNPDAYVFVGRPKYNGMQPETMLDPTTIGAIVRRMANRAAEEVPSIDDKPTHPHALRHNFVTIALRRGMEESAIKHQIGHAPDSSVMESTYAHLKDSDHIRATRKAFGKETEEPESKLTPDVCPQCGTSPPAEAQVCHICGKEFTPKAQNRGEDVGETARDTYQEIDIENMNTLEKMQAVDEMLDDPEVRDILFSEMAESDE